MLYSAVVCQLPVLKIVQKSLAATQRYINLMNRGKNVTRIQLNSMLSCMTQAAAHPYAPHAWKPSASSANNHPQRRRKGKYAAAVVAAYIAYHTPNHFPLLSFFASPFASTTCTGTAFPSPSFSSLFFPGSSVVTWRC